MLIDLLTRFQEVVPLRTANVLGLDNRKICKKWNSLIKKTLNKKTSGRQAAAKSSDLQFQEFRCVTSKQMVGIFISVWVRGDLHPYVRNPNVSCVGCGIMGCLGNKVIKSYIFTLHAFMKHRKYIFFKYQNAFMIHNKI